MNYSLSILQYTDYYPYGMLMPGRHGEADNSSYRYGFNGMEKDDEMKGSGNSYTTMFRQYDPRLGRWLTIDPAKHIGSPYAGFANNPIFYIDHLGDSTYNFNVVTGAYAGMTDLDEMGAKGAFVLQYSFTVNEKVPVIGGVTIEGQLKVMEFEFADPINDPSKIQYGMVDAAIVVQDHIIKDILSPEIFEPENQGLLSGAGGLLLKRSGGKVADESKYTEEEIKNSANYDYGTKPKVMDIAKKNGYTNPDRILYVTTRADKAMAHNKVNFGNFLWGATAGVLLVPKDITLGAANINNIITYGTNDSVDDQESVGEGWEWSEENVNNDDD